MLNERELSDLKKLCRIECTEEEETTFRNSLDRILEYINQVQEVDTQNVATCSYPLKEAFPQPLREDEVGETLSRDTFLANAPDQIGGMIRVPPVLREP
jgi:aspartyl-tRNA(Asn)/glutamyl-tRNA(Gln) amidotransferase subunit C